MCELSGFQLILECVRSRIHMELKTVEKLISLIRDRPLIYGPRPKRGKKKHQKILDELWSEVAFEMNRSVRECKLKWTTLRNCYARLLREERCQKVKKRHWHLRNEMSFLRGHIQPYSEIRRRSLKRTVALRSKMPTDSSSNNLSIDENTSPATDQSKSQKSSTSNTIPNPNIQEFVITESNEQLNTWEQQNHSAPENETLYSCPVIDFNPFPLPERINETTENSITPPKNKEEQSEANILFLRSLLPDINKLSDRKQRIFKRKTLEVLEFLFEDSELDANRDESHLRQFPRTRLNYNYSLQQQNLIIEPEKFVQKVEPTSP